MEEPKRTLTRVIAYCVQDQGAKSAVDLDEDVAEQILERQHVPDDYDEDNEAHRQIVLGCERLGVNYIASVRGILAEAKKARDIIAAVEAHSGPSPLVFIGAKLLWECHQGELPYRDFTVLCAVNSWIGMKATPQLIRQEPLRLRAAGFKSQIAYKQGGTPQFKTRPLLTISQLKTTLDNLEERNLIVRVQASKTCVYFSKVERDTTLKQVAEIVRKRAAAKLAARREEEREAMKGARNELPPGNDGNGRNK